MNLEWSEWKGYDCTRGRMVYDETTGVVKIEVGRRPIYLFNPVTGVMVNVSRKLRAIDEIKSQPFY